MKLAGITSHSVADRLGWLRKKMADQELEAYWIAKKANVRYLSDFTGDATTLVVTQDTTVLITDSRFEEQAEHEAEVERVEVREDGMAETVGGVCETLGSPPIGVTSSNITYADGQTLASVLPAKTVRPRSDGLVESLRMQKGRDEVEAIGAATRLAEDAFRAFQTEVQAGRSEKWLGGWLEWEMKRRGAEGEAFDIICAVDERASLPHAQRTDRELAENSSLLVDWGARLEGYHSDLTRVLGTGTIPRRVCELVEIVVEAQQAALEVIGPGIACSEVDRAARDVIAEAGYGSQFAHSLGHGVGLEVHEAPGLARGNDQNLEPGMVVTIEPGIYIPGQAGVRVEDLVVVTSNGHEQISSLGVNKS